jgi:hypothetical protein
MSKLKEIKNHIYPTVDYATQKTISYSQYSTYKQCPHKWNLQYAQSRYVPSYSVNMTFGTALHEALQEYLRVMYEESGRAADDWDIESFFQEVFTKEYTKQYKENNNQHFSSAEEMREFYNDGVEIINWFKSKRGEYFSKKGWHLVGCEIPLITNVDAHINLIFKGYIDLILYHEATEEFYIYDIKTSTRGWTDKEKKDENKQNQLILYKHYFAKQFGVDVDKINVEFFILKRKIYENSDYPQKRIQIFAPAAGKIKLGKAVKSLEDFIQDCFNDNGSFKQKDYPKIVSNNCKYCPFYKDKSLCDRSKK